MHLEKIGISEISAVDFQLEDLKIFNLLDVKTTILKEFLLRKFAIHWNYCRIRDLSFFKSFSHWNSRVEAALVIFQPS